MIRRNTWITLCVFAVLLVFAVWWTRFRPATGETTEATPTPEPLWEIQASQIVGLRIEDLSGGTAVEIHRTEDGEWQVLEPADRTVAADRVDQATSWLEVPRPRSAIVGQDNLADFGLAEPQSRVTVTLDDGSTRILEIGSETPMGTTTYARLPDSGDILVLSKYGLDEVLGLLDELLATQTPTVATTATEAAPTPTPGLSATPVPPATGTASP
jgi:hypothetical protein